MNKQREERKVRDWQEGISLSLFPFSLSTQIVAARIFAEQVMRAFMARSAQEVRGRRGGQVALAWEGLHSQTGGRSDMQAEQRRKLRARENGVRRARKACK